MDMPSLPTDNLYKFLTIGGVALTVGAVYLMGNLDRNAERYTDIAVATNEEWVKHTDAQIRELEDLRRFLDNTDRVAADLAQIDPKMDADTAKALRESKLTNLRQRVRSFEIGADILTDRAEFLKSRNKTLVMETEAKRSTIQTKAELTSEVMLPAGWVCMTVGFLGWYWKVQRYHDRQIKAEAEKAERELTQPKPPVTPSTAAVASAPAAVAPVAPTASPTPVSEQSARPESPAQSTG